MTERLKKRLKKRKETKRMEMGEYEKRRRDGEM